MNFDRNCLRLYAVTDRAWVGRQTLCQQVEAALQGGATCVQLREKQLDKAAFLAEARQIAALCRRYGAPFIVNDDLDIALACGADGVHVGQDDLSAAEVRRRAGSRFIVGVSAHNGRGCGRRLPRGGGGLWLGHQDRRLPADPGRPARDLRGGAHPGGGHRRGERPQYPRAAGQRRGGGGCRLGHHRRAGHHRRLPGAARPGRYIVIGKRSRP